jgi:hypothetical protein
VFDLQRDHDYIDSSVLNQETASDLPPPGISSPILPLSLLEQRQSPDLPSPGVPSSFLPLDKKIEQENAANELKAICQPKGVPLTDVKNFVYRVERPFSTRIYIIDSGLDKSSEVSNTSALDEMY